MKLSHIRHAVLPGSILATRPLPYPPRPQGGLLATLGKFLSPRNGMGDLRTELLHVGALLRENQSDPARLLLDRIHAHLREIRRDGTQFVLNRSEWESILAAGASARLSHASPGITATLEDILATLTEFAGGRMDRSLVAPMPCRE